jgi:hypothetical protein
MSPSSLQPTALSRPFRLATILFLVFVCGCAAHKGLGVDVINPLDGSRKLVGGEDGIRVEGEGIGWTREMFSARFGRTYLTLRLRNERGGRLVLKKDDINLKVPEDSVGDFPIKMVRLPGTNHIKELTLEPGGEATLRMYFLSRSYARRRDGVIVFRFREEVSKDRISVRLPIYLQEAPLHEHREYEKYLTGAPQ